MEHNKTYPGFDYTTKKAETLLDKEKQLTAFLNKASEKLKNYKTQVYQVCQELDMLIKMVSAYLSGEYRQIPWKAIVMALTAIIYFVNPLDIVPDFLGPLGFVDDALVIGYFIDALKEEIEQFSNAFPPSQNEQK